MTEGGELLALTPRQLEVLKFVDATFKDRGVSPTMEEIGSFLGVHKSTAGEHVLKLVDRGALATSNWGMPRSVYLTDAARGHLETLTA